MPIDWTPPPGARDAGPLYLDEVQEFVFDNLINRQEGDTDGEVKTNSTHVALDYKTSADPDDPMVDRVSIWHKPLQSNAASIDCDAGADEWQVMCSVVLDRQGEWEFHAQGRLKTSFGYTSHKFNCKIGIDTGTPAALTLSTEEEATPAYFGDSNDCIAPLGAHAVYTSEADDEEIILYVGHPGAALGGESAVWKGRLFASWKGPVV